MKVSYTTRSGRMVAEIENDTVKGLFDDIGTFQEVFDCVCGKCGGDELKFVTRTIDENDYHELRCENPTCRAKLSFGAHKKGGGLFPRRKDADDAWLPDGGWMKWNPQTKKEE